MKKLNQYRLISLWFLVAVAAGFWPQAPAAAQEAAVPDAVGTSAAPPMATETSAEPPVSAPAPAVPQPPTGQLRVNDVPSDNGTAVEVVWQPAADYPQPEAWVIDLVQMQNGKEAKDRKTLPAGKPEYTVQFQKLAAGAEVTVTAAAQAGGQTSQPGATAKGKPRGNWFNFRRVNVLIALGIYFGLVSYFVKRAKSGASLFIRRIAGLDAVEEAVGRATEMGRPILYVPGLSTMSDVATIAALNILGPVAEKAAVYETKLIVPNRDPIVYTVAREVVKSAFSAAGRPDLFNEEVVFFLTDSQFGYTAAVDGIMIREKPATNFFLGMFWAESLVLAETGASTGAIQIAGTDATTQLPFFIVSCDYTLIGEELYAASAYLGKEPVLKGTLKAQDYMKLVLLFVAAVGLIMTFFHNFWLYTVLGLQ